MPDHGLPTAQTAHDDLQGSLALDLADGPESLALLAKQAGIDIDRYQPVGLNLVFEQGELHARVYCLDRQRLEGFALEHGGKLPVVCLPGTLTLAQVVAQVTEAEFQLFDHRKALAHFSWVETEPDAL